MHYRPLGETGLKVSRLCFGTLTIGPLQAGLPEDEGTWLLAQAFLEFGVNFYDTAELYGTYGYLGRFLRQIGPRASEVVVASKSYAYDRPSMAKSLDLARRELGRDYVDIFLLHEQDSEHTLRGHREAFDYLLEARERGWVRAVGISTHAVAGVRAALAYPGVQVIHPIINSRGLGIIDGTLEDMLDAVKAARMAGIGIYSMKALGGGYLYQEAETSLRFVNSLPWVDSVAVGLRTRQELALNSAILSGAVVEPGAREAVAATPRQLVVHDWCSGCRSCLEACHQEALEMGDNNRVRVDHERCILCGYCGGACQLLALKII